jgi:hypothetical protein
MSGIRTVDVDYEGMRDEIYKRIDLIYYAVCDTQSAWMKRVAIQETNRDSYDERTNYELRVEFSGSSISIRWLYYRFVLRGNNKVRVLKSISIPENGKYEKYQFKHAQDWELDIITGIEEAISPYRVQLKHLMKAHQSIIYAAKASNRPINPIPIKNRVEKQSHSIAKYKQQYHR